MDAREKLRRYLEQRRDLGERELVLDDMSVQDVLRIVGAARGEGSGAAANDDEAAAPARRDAAPAIDRTPRADTAADAPRAGGKSGDADGSTTDWRAMLRASGLTPESRTPEGSPPRPPAAAAAGARPASDPGRPAPRDPAITAEDTMATRRKPAANERDGGATAPPSGDAPAWVSTLGVEVGVQIGGSAPRDPEIEKLPSLDAIARATERCRRCALYATATHAVPGEGNATADVVCVGEAPGASEDETGRPFVGAAGQLLTKILAAIKLSREDVFICNVLKHRPPGNRNPAPDEVAACSPYLVRQLELVKPKVIVTFGTFASQTLLETKTPIGKLRGRVHFYHGIPLIVTYHPAALLRNAAWKRPTWEDVQLARRILDRAVGA